jgi:2-haloacid dehalogenase
VDWEGGLGSFLYDMARRHGDHDPPPGRVLRQRWEELQFAMIQGPWRYYRDVLSESLAEWAGERGYRWNENDGEALLRAMESWQPFPDTVPALRRAQAAGLQLMIVSNTDSSIMQHTLRQLEVEFDEVLVAEDCRAYKPAPLPFERAVEQLGESPEHIVHVAFGFKYDIGPAQGVGLRTAWVNRHGEPMPQGPAPDFEWPDLRGLAELAEG